MIPDGSPESRASPPADGKPVAVDGIAPRPASSSDDAASGRSPPPGRPRKQRPRVTRADITRFIHAVRDSDDAVVDDAVKAVRMSAKLVSGRNPADRRGATRFPEG